MTSLPSSWSECPSPDPELKKEGLEINPKRKIPEENLTSSIQSYNHAIRILTENGDTMRASGLAMELGDALISLEKHGEALTFYLNSSIDICI